LALVRNALSPHDGATLGLRSDISVVFLHGGAVLVQTQLLCPTFLPIVFHTSSTKAFTLHSAMSFEDHRRTTWRQPSPFALSHLLAQSHSLTSGVSYSAAGLPLKTEVSSPVDPLTSSYIGSHIYSCDSSVFGGSVMACGSQARWSTAGSDSNSSRSPLERLGFKLHLTSGEKKTRGQASHPTSISVSNEAQMGKLQRDEGRSQTVDQHSQDGKS
jgi:hypothetical protein